MLQNAGQVCVLPYRLSRDVASVSRVCVCVCLNESQEEQAKRGIDKKNV